VEYGIGNVIVASSLVGLSVTTGLRLIVGAIEVE
jgi:hypothetical protein